MLNFLEKYAYLIFLFALAVMLVVLAVISPGYYGGTDNINHYFISHYAFKHPELFLDPWGRPLFTILSSPFAWFGFTGIKLFNVMLGLLTAWLVFLTTRKLGLRQASLAIVFVIFTPMYCIMLLTGLTEVIFSFVLVLAVYLFYRESFIASAIAISFLPFARNEGIFIMPIFLLAFTLRKKYLSLPFLLTGTVIMSIIGSSHYHDILWLFHNSPYPVHHTVYTQSGPLFHFFLKMPEMMGLPLLVLFIVGFLYVIIRFFSRDRAERIRAGWEFWLILAPFGAYFIFHSVAYWKNLGGSIGLIRVITGILPLGALTAMIGYDWLAGFLQTRWQKAGFFLLTAFMVILVNFRLFDYPSPLGFEEKTIRKMAPWVKNLDTFKNKIYFNDLNVPFYLDIDRYDYCRCEQKWFLVHMDWVAPGSLFIWDAHFGPNECRIPLDSLMLNPRFRLLNIYQPDEPANTFGGYNYEVYVFQCVPGPAIYDNRAIRDSIYRSDEKAYSLRLTKSCDFETACTSYNLNKRVTDIYHSPLHSYRIDENDEFSPGFTIRCREIPGISRFYRVHASVFVYPRVPFRENSVKWVVSMESRGNVLGYQFLLLDSLKLPLNQWSELKMNVRFPKASSGDDEIKVYFWHLGKEPFYMDDLKVDYLSKTQ